jgi:hypothetical protein
MGDFSRTDHSVMGTGVEKDGRGNTMKILRIPFVIALLVLAGRLFNAGAQTVTNLYSFPRSPTDGQLRLAGWCRAATAISMG